MDFRFASDDRLNMGNEIYENLLISLFMLLLAARAYTWLPSNDASARTSIFSAVSECFEPLELVAIEVSIYKLLMSAKFL
jgi:hypothetical protein